jgi:hypothetical protein
MIWILRYKDGQPWWYKKQGEEWVPVSDEEQASHPTDSSDIQQAIAARILKDNNENLA